MAGDDAADASQEECSAVYLCDLSSGLLEEELRDLFGQYGDILSFEQVHDFSEEAAFVEFAKAEVAQEVQRTMNYASLRHKTCRCLFASSLDVIRQTMQEGHRLVVESLDLNIQSQGLHDMFSLFGSILDCKVEVDDDERSRGYGFVHFGAAADASKAISFLDGTQVGDSMLKVRQFAEKDSAMFTGCFYARPDCIGKQDRERVEESDNAKDVDSQRPAERLKLMQDLFRSLQAHHLEVHEDAKLKLERLKVLVQLYTPSRDQPMMVIASPSNLQAIGEVIEALFTDGSYSSISFASTADARKRAIGGFDSGDIHVLLLASDVATRPDFELSKTPAVLVNFDFPNTLRAYLNRIFQRADRSSRVHSFFSPKADKQLAVPLMAEMEEAGHEIPPTLVDFWSQADDQ